MEQIKINTKVEEVAIDKITPYEGSHKTDAVIGMLMDSIRDFGINQPISVDKNFVVVTGNGVFKAARALGMKTIPCIILDELSDEEIAQYRIADDKTSEFSTWNEKKLYKELSYLEDPMSVQKYFDEDIMGKLGLNVKPSGSPAVSTTPPPSHSPSEKTQADEAFRDEIRKIDINAVVRQAEYVEYTCSKCGKVIKVKR